MRWAMPIRCGLCSPVRGPWTCSTTATAVDARSAYRSRPAPRPHRRRSAGPSRCSAPHNLSGRGQPHAQHAAGPQLAARGPHRGRVVDDHRPLDPMASRQGPSSSSYWAPSRSCTTGAVSAGLYPPRPAANRDPREVARRQQGHHLLQDPRRGVLLLRLSQQLTHQGVVAVETFRSRPHEEPFQAQLLEGLTGQPTGKVAAASDLKSQRAGSIHPPPSGRRPGRCAAGAKGMAGADQGGQRTRLGANSGHLKEEAPGAARREVPANASRLGRGSPLRTLRYSGSLPVRGRTRAAPREVRCVPHPRERCAKTPVVRGRHQSPRWGSPNDDLGQGISFGRIAISVSTTAGAPERIVVRGSALAPHRVPSSGVRRMVRG